MKNKEKAYSIALASTVMILFLILVSSMASASSGQNPPSTTTLPSITSGAGDPSDDEVLSDELSSEEIVTDTESIQAAAPKITEKRITTNTSEQWSPVIYGNKIAWQDLRNGNWDIYIYDLSTKKEISTPMHQISGALISTVTGWCGQIIAMESLRSICKIFLLKSKLG